MSDLDFLADQYQWYLDHLRANLPDQVRWETGWFPLMGVNDGYVVAYCLDDPAAPVRCTVHTVEDYFDDNSPEHTITLQECVTLWTEAIRDGRWTCDESDFPSVRWNGTASTDTPLELQLTGLAP